jgi:ligand-binding SRPBCC domain-containing protein
MEYWKHTHSFESIDEEKTRIQERIEYTHPEGLRSLFTRLLFGRFGLTLLFTYRKLATRRNLGEQK